MPELDRHDPPHILAPQAVEQDDLVDAVEELRPERRLDHGHHVVAHLVDILALAEIDEILRTQVRGHHDQRVAEIDRTALAVGQPAVVEHLQEHVEDVRMRLLDLVEQDHLIGPAPHSLGQRAAFLVADIAGRRPDQPGHGMLLHELRHVDADHRRLVVEQEVGERLGQFGLADAGRAEEHERADRPVRILQAGAGTPHRLRHRLHRFALTDDALRDLVFHPQQLVALSFEHLVDRNTGPARDDMSDVVGRDGLLDHRALAVFLRLCRGQLLLQFGDAAIGQFARLLELTAALGDRQFVARLVELLLQVRRQAELVLFGRPGRGHRGRLFFQPRQLFLEPRKAVLRRIVLLGLQRLALDLELHDAAVDLVERFRLRIDLHPQPRRRLVDEVNRLVGQEAVGDVAVRQGRGRNQRRIGDAHLVVLLVLLLQPAQDRHRVLDGRFLDEHRLEAPRQGGILLDVLAVFVERGRADAVQLAACQSWLQQVGRVHRAVRLAGAHQRVHFIDEQDDVAVGRRHFGQDGFEPLFELAAIFRAGNQRAHVERHQLLVLERFGHVAIDDPERQPFGDRRLADAGLADQHRIVLGPARQHLDGSADLVVAADHGIELACTCFRRQVARIFLQRVIALLGPGAVGGAALADIVDDLIERRRGHAGLRQNVGCLGRLLDRHRSQEPFDGDEAVAGLLRHLLGRREHLGERLREVELAVAALDLGQRLERGFDAEAGVLDPSAGPFDQRGGKTLLVVDQHLEQVFRRELLVVARQRHGLCGLNEAPNPLGVFFNVHRCLPSLPGPLQGTGSDCGDGPPVEP